MKENNINNYLTEMDVKSMIKKVQAVSRSLPNFPLSNHVMERSSRRIINKCICSSVNEMIQTAHVGPREFTKDWFR